jgi:hypothetical protein
MNPFNRIGDDPSGDSFYAFDAQEGPHHRISDACTGRVDWL